MESDMQDRMKRRARDLKEAEELKVKGNEALKRGLYKTANKHYTDAMELKRDLLPLYTNRALARLKLEDFTGVIDDTTKLLEYNEVFNDGFLKEKDLCFKAFMRRCQALRGQKDYELALKDLNEAEKLFPEDGDVKKLKSLTLEDIELEVRIKKIMGSSELLKGKDYIDFLLDFLQGRKDEAAPVPDAKTGEKKYCVHELTEEEGAKLKTTLTSDKDITFYFNVKDGFKTLVASLQYNVGALETLQIVLDGDAKLQEDF
jgi:tetratricopeptide (TPR) repeat protein